jgi:FAD/FMN-containing dehydrogenase
VADEGGEVTEQRWIQRGGDYRGKFEDSPENVEAFLKEIAEVCRKHGLSISHEDGHGAFIVTDDRMEENIAWVNAASLELK